MGDSILFKLLVMGGLIWFILQFYWLRVLACLILLALWGGAVAVAPIYLALDSLGDGDIFVAIFILAVSALPAFLWWLTAKMAYQWAQREERRYGGFWKAWNAR